MKLHPRLAITALALAAALTHAALAADALPSYHGDPSQTSVSGLSSGAFMAVQYQVAYSGSVVGAGVVAGGPYYCAAGNLFNASICMGQVPFVPPNSTLMVTAAAGFASLNQIDPLSNLQKARIYVFSGTKDTVVYQQAVDSTVSFFKEAGVPGSNLKYVNNVPAGHAFITPSFGNMCADNAPPYISHCEVGKQRYDQAGALLQYIYGPLKPPAKSLTGRIVPFSQREFAASATGMADTGFVYVPKSCDQGAACKVHVAFHGCKQSAAVVGDDFYEKTNYNYWADTNNILVLYPQVNASTIPFNPQGCWDWFGYTGPDYAVKSGSQLTAVNAMVGRLLSKP
ncbi:extracellular catalytic domain type 2 short-chain-length polyhydroxyalkanoate depolymerase [Burkholderia pyrrocinia]|uniref:extracellular catalytic domain type 2 short-chain-length polyhydroxyalkanoate depolymerase n=1 Tax=Burkholderia pyrrocinia TaxID=60550 RepID=UPI001588691D|nr:PHB depolymerase family esterase [Burkholderia pyrrocinia]